MKRFKEFIYSEGQISLFIVLIGGLILGSSILMIKRRYNPPCKIQVVSACQPRVSSKQSTASIRPRNSTLTTKSQTFLININTAEKEELQLLPGVGPKIAERIIEYRKNNGRFKQKEEIMEVKGIGKKRFERWKDLITVD